MPGAIPPRVEYTVRDRIMTTTGMASDDGTARNDKAHHSGRKILRLDDLGEDNGDEEEPESVRLHRAMSPRAEEGSGITFQRCGGGRRVVRKQRGGS